MAVTKDESELDEIKDAFEYDTGEYSDIRKAGSLDVRALTPLGPWTDADRAKRAEEGRPCLHMDELGQYVNQLINDIRAQKRGIEVNPTANHNDQTAPENEAKARLLSSLVRQIEYKSNANQAYTSMFEDTVQRSYGFLQITTRYVHDTITGIPTAQAFEQEIRIESVANPDSVTPDGNALLPDLSDMRRCMVRDRYTHKQFKREWPEAEVTDFSPEAIEHAGSTWMDSKNVWVGAFWQIEDKPRKLLLLPDPVRPDDLSLAVGVWRDTVPKDEWDSVKKLVLRERSVPFPEVSCKYTNGLEIMETRKWPGKYIPIVGCLGKVLWVEKGAGVKRELHSLIRMGLDPAMLYDFYCTGEAEMVGMTPKFPYFAYRGQLKDDQKQLLAKSIHEPVGLIEVEPTLDETGQQLLPHPQRQPWDPPIQAFTVGREEQRRAIQSAVGGGFLPTAAQRRNEKSGIALKQIETSAQKGSFHFVDHFNDSVRHCGVIVVDLAKHIYDTARDIYVRAPDDKPISVRINDPDAPPHKEYGTSTMINDVETDDFDVTVSTGPSYESERDKASDFADQLAAQPDIFRAIGPLVVRLKNLGPQGDALAAALERMQPPELREPKEGEQQIPPEVQQQIAQAEKMLKAMQAQIQEQQKVIDTEQVKAGQNTELAKQKLDAEYKLAELKYQYDLKLADVKAKLELSLLTKKIAHDNIDREDEQKHELAIAAADAGHAERASERAAEQMAAQTAVESPEAGDAGL